MGQPRQPRGCRGYLLEMPMSHLEAALSAAALGLHVHPCQPRGKAPILTGWLTRATCDPTQISAWWTTRPDANIGVLTGAPSGIVVLDVDPRNAGDESLAELERRHGPLPATWEALSGGGGRHLYFLHPGGHVPCSSGKLGPGLDLKADGGNVLGPGSVHPETGRPYCWEILHTPTDTPLAPLPAWLLALLIAGPTPTTTPLDPQGDLPDVTPENLGIRPWLRELLRTGARTGPRAKYASRSELLFDAIRGLVRAGLDDPTIAAIILASPVGAKAREKGTPWLLTEIARVRAKTVLPVPPVTAAPAEPTPPTDDAGDLARRVEELERQLAAAREEIDQVRRENQDLKANMRAITDVIGNPELSPSERIVGVVLALESVATQNKPALDDHVKITLPAIADRAGVSTDTAGRAIARFAEAGALSKLRTRTYDAEADTYRTELFLKLPGATLPEALRLFATLTIERPQRPPAPPSVACECGSLERVVVCAGCGSVLEEPQKPQIAVSAAGARAGRVTGSYRGGAMGGFTAPVGLEPPL